MQTAERILERLTEIDDATLDNLKIIEDGDCTFMVIMAPKCVYWVSPSFISRSRKLYPSEFIKISHYINTNLRHPNIIKPIWIKFDVLIGRIIKFPKYSYLNQCTHKINDSKFMGIANQLIRVCRFIHSQGYYGKTFDLNSLAFSNGKLVLLNLDEIYHAGDHKLSDMYEKFMKDTHKISGCLNEILALPGIQVSANVANKVRTVIEESYEKKNFYLNRLQIALQSAVRLGIPGKKIISNYRVYIQSTYKLSPCPQTLYEDTLIEISHAADKPDELRKKMPEFLDNIIW